MQAFQQLFGLKSLHLQSLKLIEAIDDENLELVVHILNDVDDPKERIALMKKKTKLKRNCLHLACYYGCHDIVDYLIKIAKLENITDQLWGEDIYGYDPAKLCMVRGFRKQTQAVIRFEIASISKRYMIFKSLQHAQFPLGKMTSREINNELHWACYHQDKESIMHIMLNFPRYIVEPNEEGLFPMDLILGFKTALDEERSIEVLETVLNYIYQNVLSPYVSEIRTNISDNPHEFLKFDDGFKFEELTQLLKIGKAKKNTYKRASQNGNDDYSDENPHASRFRLGVNRVIQRNKDVFASNSASQAKPIVIGSLKEKLNDKKRFLYHMLLWCMVTSKTTYIAELINDFQLNPFRITEFDKNCIHVAAQFNRTEALTPILEQKYLVDGKLVTRSERIAWINMASHETGETAMHYAMAKRGYDMALLLLKHGAECGWMNSRGLKPLDIHYDSKRAIIDREWDLVSKQNIFSKEGKARIEKLEREAFLTFSSGYQVVIVANLENKLDYSDMLLCQMIKRAPKATGIDFEYKFFQSIANFDKIFIGLKFPEDVINKFADTMQLPVYNLKNKFTLEFQKDKQHEFEVLRNRHVQLIIEHILKERLGIKSFIDLGQLDTYYFLHDFDRLSSIQKAWKLRSFLAYSGIFNELKQLNKVNMIFNYFGIEYGMMTGFLLMVKSYMHYMIVVLLAYSIAYYYFDRVVEPGYITLPFMGSLWLLVVLTSKGWERREGDHFSMLGFTQKDFGQQTYEDKFRVDSVTGRTTNIRIGMPWLKRLLSLKLVTIVVLMAIICFLYYDAIFKKYIFDDDRVFSREETNSSGAILGIITATAANLMILLSAGWKTGVDFYLLDLVVNLMFSLAAPGLYILSIKKSDDAEEVFFAFFYCSSIVMHLLIFDVSSIAAYYLRQATLSRKWSEHYDGRLHKFKNENISFADYGKEADKNFEAFKEEMITHRQFEYNDKMLPPLDILPEFFAVFSMFLTFVFFSVFYPLTCMAFFLFLVLKIWLFVKKSMRCYRRPIDYPRDAIRLPAKLLVFTSYALPGFFGLLLLLKTGFFQRLRASKEMMLTQYAWASFTEPQLTLLVYIAIEHSLLLINFLVLSVIPSTSNYAQTATVREQVYRRQHFERLNFAGQSKEAVGALAYKTKTSMFPSIHKEKLTNVFTAVAGAHMTEGNRYKYNFLYEQGGHLDKDILKHKYEEQSKDQTNVEYFINIDKFSLK